MHGLYRSINLRETRREIKEMIKDSKTGRKL